MGSSCNKSGFPGVDFSKTKFVSCFFLILFFAFKASLPIKSNFLFNLTVETVSSLPGI